MSLNDINQFLPELKFIESTYINLNPDFKILKCQFCIISEIFSTNMILTADTESSQEL